MLPADLVRTVRVADGAWATELWARGVPRGTMPELACVTQPDAVGALARVYVEAGAEFLTTNSFRANRFALARAGVPVGVHDLNLAAARVARRAADEAAARGAGRVTVVGSIGPSGKILAVREVSESEAAAAFEEHAAGLAEGGVDAILLETFSELRELAVAIQAVRRVCRLPIIASMSYDSGPQRTRTMMGAEAGECASALDASGADVIGCNCGAGIAHVLPVVVAMRSASGRPLWVKPNAGLPELEEDRAVYRQPPEEFAALVPRLVEAGANIVGSCCGSGPEHTRRIAAVLRGQTERRMHAD